MVQLTEKAVGKVKEIMASQTPAPAGLRIAVVGGGCSGFSYSMAFENTPNMLDKTYQYGDLRDETSPSPSNSTGGSTTRPVYWVSTETERGLGPQGVRPLFGCP